MVLSYPTYCGKKFETFSIICVHFFIFLLSLHTPCCCQTLLKYSSPPKAISLHCKLCIHYARDPQKLEEHLTYIFFIHAFYFTTGSHAWISFLFLPTKFYIIFILSPTPFLLCFCFILIFIWSLNLSWSLTPFSSHNVRFRFNILTHLQSGYHLLLILL